MRRVLFLAYYFPPLGMAGTQRVAKWCKYFVREGWQVSVITVKPIAYYASDPTLLEELAGTHIIRTGSLDPARLLYLLRGKKSLQNSGGAGRGNLLYWFLLPDPRILWIPFALWHAWREMRRRQIPFVVTSGPPHASHLVGWLLSRVLPIRWVSDFRDTWLREEFPQAPTKAHRLVQQAIEKLVLRKAHAVTAVSQGLAAQLQQTGQRPQGTTHYIPHGYDHEDFVEPPRRNDDRFRISYVGALSHIQDPRPLLQGFRGFVQTAQLSSAAVLLQFVGADLTGNLHDWIVQHEIQEYVDLAGYLPHAAAVSEMRVADLLIFLANPGTGRTIIPSKTFEYLAAGRPILLIGEKIEGVQFLLQHAHCRHCEFDAVDAIVRALLAFYKEFREGTLSAAVSQPLEFSRQQQAKRLAEILMGLI